MYNKDIVVFWKENLFQLDPSNDSYAQKSTLQEVYNQYTQLSLPTGKFFHQLSTLLGLKKRINTANQDITIHRDETKIIQTNAPRGN